MQLHDISRPNKLKIILLVILVLIPMLWFIQSPELAIISIFLVTLGSYLFLGCCLVLPPILALGIVGKMRKNKERENKDLLSGNKP